MKQSPGTPEITTRRRFIRLAAEVAGIAALASCASKTGKAGVGRTALATVVAPGAGGPQGAESAPNLVDPELKQAKDQLVANVKHISNRSLQALGARLKAHPRAMAYEDAVISGQVDTRGGDVELRLDMAKSQLRTTTFNYADLDSADKVQYAILASYQLAAEQAREAQANIQSKRAFSVGDVQSLVANPATQLTSVVVVNPSLPANSNGEHLIGGYDLDTATGQAVADVEALAGIVADTVQHIDFLR